MTIYIGAIVGGADADDTTIDRRITTIGRIFQRRRENSPAGVRAGVNVVFSLPGDITAPNFEGLRKGNFSAEKKLVMIQAAVPDEVMKMSDPDPYMFRVIRQAVRLAESVFRKAGIPYDVDEQMHLIDDVERELQLG